MNKKTNIRLVGPSMFLKNKMGEKPNSARSDSSQNTTKAERVHGSLFDTEDNKEQIVTLKANNSANKNSNGNVEYSNTQPYKRIGGMSYLDEAYQANLKSKSRYPERNVHQQKTLSHKSKIIADSFGEDYFFKAAYPELRKRSQFTKGVQSVLIDKKDPHLLQTVEQDQVTRRVEVHYAHSFINLFILLFETIFNILGSLIVSILLFYIIPKNLADICQNVDVYEGDCSSSYKAAKWTLLILCFPLYLFFLTEFFPRLKKLPGYNSLKDRQPVLARLLLKFEIDHVISTPLFRIIACSILFTLSDTIGSEKRILQWICFALCSYYFVLGFIGHFSAFFSESFLSITVPAAFVTFGPEKTPFYYLQFKNREDIKLKVLYFVYSAIKAIFLFLSAVLFLIFGGDSVTKILIFGFLSIFSAIYLFFVIQFFKNKLVSDNHPFYMIIAFLETMFLLIICIDPDMNKVISLLIFSISLISFLLSELLMIALAVIQYRKKEKGQGRVSEKKQIHKMNNTNYSVIFSMALLFVCIVLHFLIMEVDFNKAENPFKADAIAHFVYWCANFQQTYKNMFYSLNLTETEVMTKIVVLSYFTPVMICVVIVVYYIITDRHAQISQGYIIYFIAVFFALVFVVNGFTTILNHLSEGTFVWPGVSESTIWLKETDKMQNRNDICLLGVMMMFAVYMLCDWDINVDENRKPVDFVQNKSESDCDYKLRQIITKCIRRFFSVTVCLYLLVKAITYLASDNSNIMSVSPKNFLNTHIKFGNAESGCSNEMTRDVLNMITQSQSQLDNIMNYKSGIEAKVLIHGKSLQFLIVAAPLVSILSQLSSSLFFSSGTELGGVLAVFAFALSISSLLFGSFVYLIVYFSNYSLIYPFYDVDVSPQLVAAVIINIFCFFPPIVGVIEQFFVPLPPKSSSV